MIAAIATIAEKKKFSDHMETTLQRAIAAIAGQLFHMITMIAAIAEVFFFSQQSQRSHATVAIIWKPGFNLIMACFKRKDCLQRNLYLNCVSL